MQVEIAVRLIDSEGNSVYLDGRFKEAVHKIAPRSFTLHIPEDMDIEETFDAIVDDIEDTIMCSDFPV